MSVKSKKISNYHSQKLLSDLKIKFFNVKINDLATRIKNFTKKLNWLMLPIPILAMVARS